MDNRVFLSDSFEYLLRYLYGQNYRFYFESITFTKWKQLLGKITNSIETSIDNTVEIIDKKHRKDMVNICRITQEQISKSENLNDLNENTILCLIKLVFYLLGEIPDHWDLEKVNKPKHWKLNSHRQIMYYQSNEHKVNLIIDNAPPIDQSNEYNKSYLMEKLHKEFHRDYTKFLDWYIAEHKDKYYELF